MLKILNNSLNGIVLGQKKADFDDVILNNPNYSLEFDRKHKIQSDSELITVSSLRNCDEFCLNGKVINFSNLEKFLEEEDPLIEVSDEENYFYIFPQYIWHVQSLSERAPQSPTKPEFFHDNDIPFVPAKLHYLQSHFVVPYKSAQSQYVQDFLHHFL